MSENIEIKVQDGVSPYISPKLRAIATDARDADAAIKNLQSSLAGVSSSAGLAKLQTELAKTALAQQKLQTEIQKTDLAYLKTEEALNKAVTAESNAATAAQRLATEQQKTALTAQKLATEQEKTGLSYLKTEAALNRAVAAESNAATAAQRLATEQQRTATAATRAGTAQTNQATAAEKLAIAEQQLVTATIKTETAQTQSSIAAERLSIAEKQLALATEKTSIAQTQGALASQKLATEQQRTAIQTANAAAAEDRAATAALRLESAQNRVSTANTSQGRSWFGLVGSIVQSMFIYQGIQLAISGVVDSIKGGIEAVNNFQMSNIQMAAILTSLAKNQTDIAGTYKRSKEYAYVLNQMLMLVDANTSLNLQNLQAITLEMAKQGVTLKLNNAEEQANFTKIANAVALYSRNGADERQVRQEISALMRGEVRQGDELAKLLNTMTNGQLPKLIVQWKNSGTVVKEIADRLTGFGPAAEDINKTWSAATSSMKTSLNLIAQAGLTSIVKDLSEWIQVANNYLREHADLIGLEIKKGWEEFRSVVESTVKFIELYGNNILTLGGIILGAKVLQLAFNAAVSANPYYLAAAGILYIVTKIDEYKKSIEGALSITATFAQSLQGLAAVLKNQISLTDYMFSNEAQLKEKLKQSAGTGELNSSLDTLKNKLDDVKNSFAFTSEERRAKEQRIDAIRQEIKALEDEKQYMLDVNTGKVSTSSSVIDKSKFDASPYKGVSPQAPELNQPAPPVDKAAEKRALTLEKVNTQLDNEAKRMFVLAPLREAQQKFDQIEESMITKKIKLTDDEKASIMSKIKANQDNLEVQKQYDAIYQAAVGPLKDYNNQQKAAKMLLDQGAISQAQYQKAVIKSSEAYANAIDPMRQYNKDLAQQFILIGTSVEKREVLQKLLQRQNEMMANATPLNEKEIQELSQKLYLLQMLTQVSQQQDSIYKNTKGAMQEQTIYLAALNKSLKDQTISLEYYNNQLVQTAIKTADIKNVTGKGDMESIFMGANSGFLKDFQTTAKGISDAIAQMFSSVTQGVSDSFAAAIIKGEDLRTSLFNLSETILTQLLSALIKIGIQYVINAALGEAAGTAAAAANMALGAATATAWAPAAAAVSLATYGSNSASAMAGMTATYSLASILSSVGKLASFADGGYTGNFAKNEIAGIVHGKEFVMDADSTSRIGIANLEALRSGAAQVNQNTGTSNTYVTNQTTQQASSQTSPKQNNIRIINLVDPKLVTDYLGTPEGEQVLINTMRRNSDKVKAIANS